MLYYADAHHVLYYPDAHHVLYDADAHRVLYYPDAHLVLCSNACYECAHARGCCFGGCWRELARR